MLNLVDVAVELRARVEAAFTAFILKNRHSVWRFEVLDSSATAGAARKHFASHRLSLTVKIECA